VLALSLVRRQGRAPSRCVPYEKAWAAAKTERDGLRRSAARRTGARGTRRRSSSRSCKPARLRDSWYFCSSLSIIASCDVLSSDRRSLRATNGERKRRGHGERPTHGPLRPLLLSRGPARRLCDSMSTLCKERERRRAPRASERGQAARASQGGEGARTSPSSSRSLSIPARAALVVDSESRVLDSSELEP
jgi:hypothetical protein